VVILLILVGASASGKSDISKILIDDYGYKKMVTTTSRNPRPGEVNGVDYHFISKKVFENRIKKDRFLEWVNYNDNYYGTPKKGATIDKILIVEPDGANHIYKHEIKDTVIIYLETDEDTRKTRMLDRGDNLIQVIDRLEKDEDHFKKNNLKHIDFIVNTTNESREALALKIHELYHHQVDQENQMSIFDVFRNDEKIDDKKEGDD
jgi:guanylate kinase